MKETNPDTGRGSRQYHSELPPFVALPKTILLDPDLSATAKVAWMLVVEQAWRETGDSLSEVELPLGDLSTLSGIGEKPLRAALRDLVKAGLMETWRRGQGLANGYRALLPSNGQNGRNGRSRTVETAVPRAGASPDVDLDLSELDTSGANAPSAAEPPKLALVDGRNLGFDALAKVCGIAAGSPRVGEIAVALNGSRATGPGIRRIVWGGRERLGASPETFERVVADAIFGRAILWRRKMGDATLTPTALAKWWVDLPGMPDRGREGGLSAADVLDLDPETL